MTFDKQPYLNDGLIAIRPLVDTDFDALYEVASDPLIWEQHQNKDRHQLGNFTRFFEESLASAGALTLIDVRSEKIIGSSRFKPIDSEDQVIEIGWSFLDRAYWGGRYNRAFKGLMVNYALQHCQVVLFYVNRFNYRSQRAMEKLGAQRITDTTKSWVLPEEKGVTFIIDTPIAAVDSRG